MTMRNEKHEQLFKISKLPNTHQQLNRVFTCLLFVIGLSLGIIAGVYLESFFSIPLAYGTLGFTSSKASSSSSSPPPATITAPTPPPATIAAPTPPPATIAALIPPPATIAALIPPPATITALTPPPTIPTPPSLMHNMDDEELFAKALSGRIDKDHLPHEQKKPKVAFMFLTKGSIPLAPLWEQFFRGHDGLYSIYVHPDPSFNESVVPENSVFYRRRIPSKKAEWGMVTMIDSERRLLANALLEDPLNQRFVLLSESCIPLFNFTTVYNYLVASRLSFIGSFDNPSKAARGRYNRKMFPEISISQWRKGSQWFEVHRDIAIKIISDQKYYPVFDKYCKPSCYSDEHYIPTLINIVSPELNSNRSVTWVDWSRPGPHPWKFGWRDIKIEFLNGIRFGSNCMHNGNTTSICFLFARKFHPDTLKSLLQIAPLLGFGS